MARSGMGSLIGRFRSLTNDPGTVYFSDDRIQEILDGRRLDFYQEPLFVIPQQVGAGSVEYHVYHSNYRQLEGTASGTVAFRLYDSSGSIVTGYSFDDQNGQFVFTANQAGSARYLDGRSYDLYGAAAEGWRQIAGSATPAYDFGVEGRRYSRSQWFEHCMEMAKQMEIFSSGSSFGSTFGIIERSDMVGIGGF